MVITCCQTADHICVSQHKFRASPEACAIEERLGASRPIISWRSITRQNTRSVEANMSLPHSWSRKLQCHCVLVRVTVRVVHANILTGSMLVRCFSSSVVFFFFYLMFPFLLLVCFIQVFLAYMLWRTHTDRTYIYVCLYRHVCFLLKFAYQQ